MLSHRWLYVLWWLCVVVFPQPVTCPDIFCYFQGNVRFFSKWRLNFVLVREVCQVLCIYVVLYCPWPWFKVASMCTVIFRIAKSFCWSSFPDCYTFVDWVQLIFQSIVVPNYDQNKRRNKCHLPLLKISLDYLYTKFWKTKAHQLNSPIKLKSNTHQSFWLSLCQTLSHVTFVLIAGLILLPQGCRHMDHFQYYSIERCMN